MTQSGQPEIGTGERAWGGLGRRMLRRFLVVSMVPMVLVGVVSYYTARESLHEQAAEALSRSVEHQGAFLENWFQYRAIELESQASMTMTRRLFEGVDASSRAGKQTPTEFVGTPRWRAVVNELGDGLDVFQEAYGYSNVLLVDAGGTVVYSTSRGAELGSSLLSGRAAGSGIAGVFEQTMLSGQTRFSDLQVSLDGSGDVVGYLCSPCMGDTGELLGVVAVELSTEQLEYVFSAIAEHKHTVRSSIVRYHEEDRRAAIQVSIGHDESGTGCVSFALEESVEGERVQRWMGTLNGDGSHGEVMVYAHSPVGGYGCDCGDHSERVLGTVRGIDVAGVRWGVVSEIPVDQAFASTGRLWRMLLGMMLATGVLAVALAGRVTRGIVRPIESLSRASNRVACGDLSQRCLVEQDDEIGGLGASFNVMTTNLRRLFKDLGNQKYAMDQHAIVSITDTSGIITYVNDRFVDISGYAQEELVGGTHRKVKGDETSDQTYKELWETISDGGVWSGEIQNRAKDGAAYWIRQTVVPLEDDTGSIKEFIAISTDISEQKETEQAMLDTNEELTDQRNELYTVLQDLDDANRGVEFASRAKSDFLANMSHEIRTPMTAILGYAETLKSEGNLELAPSERVDAVDTILRNGDHLLAIINDILDLSKIESGKMEIESIPFSVIELVSDVHGLLRIRAEESGLWLGVDFDGAIPEVIESDPTRLRQILMNVVGNAIKFTETGGVKIVTRFEPGVGGRGARVCFDVVDTGIGMSEEQIEKVFTAFSQADSSTTRRFGGTGLGLDISKRLCEMLNGEITLKSAIGEGTTVSVVVDAGSIESVEMIEDPAASTRARKTITAQHGEASRLDCRVLLAEDGVDNQRLISHILRRAGAEVSLAENGKVALESALEAVAEGAGFEVILMDMQMPVMSGYESVAELREAGYRGAIIALTAHAMDGDREKCIDAGCDDFASKPIDRAKLIGLIDGYARGASSRAAPK